jgi:hypothetical protein
MQDQSLLPPGSDRALNTAQLSVVCSQSSDLKLPILCLSEISKNAPGGNRAHSPAYLIALLMKAKYSDFAVNLEPRE